MEMVAKDAVTKRPLLTRNKGSNNVAWQGGPSNAKLTSCGTNWLRGLSSVENAEDMVLLSLRNYSPPILINWNSIFNALVRLCWRGTPSNSGCVLCTQFINMYRLSCLRRQLPYLQIIISVVPIFTYAHPLSSRRASNQNKSRCRNFSSREKFHDFFLWRNRGFLNYI